MSFQGALTQDQAKHRFSLFETKQQDNLHYDVFLKLAKGDTYSGRVTATFHLAKIGDLFFDTSAKSIDKLIVNSKTVEPTRNDRFLLVAAEELVKGKNVVVIEFTNTYRNDSTGLQYYIDTDGRQYLFTYGEPYHCNKILPCFDQPDLKATWKLYAAVPHDWIVVTNTRIDIAAKTEPKDYLSSEDLEHFKIWTFQKTLRISTYLFCVVAGPYREVKSIEKYRDVEMSCFCRESLFKSMNEQAEELFEITRVCMGYFEELFGYPYQFDKYDQVFIADHPGAMENPGCVIWSDDFIAEETPTIQSRTARAVYLTHELAHMWFGNLVTMKWWNDLWLNEAFAEFISHFAMAQINGKLKTIKFSDVWVEFFSEKTWGYSTDQLETTHPIRGDINDTHAAQNNYDGITYAKGAAVLRQFVSLIGEKNFSAGLKTYFRKHQFANTDLQDFIDCMQENYKPLDPSYPESLDEWQKQWLQTAGMNELSPLWEPSDNLTETITLKQTAVLAQHPTLRVHKMKIGFFGEGAELLEVKDFVVPAKECVTLTFEGKKKLKGVLINYEDEAFIKVRIDNISADFFKSNLKNIKDELSRILIWRAFSDMLRDGRMNTSEFIETVKRILAEEVSDVIINAVLSYTYDAITEFTPLKLRPSLNYKMFDLIYHLIISTAPENSDRVLTLRENLIHFAANKEHVDLLLKWLNNEAPALTKYPLGVNDKLRIIELAVAKKKLDLNTQSRLYAKVAQENPSKRSMKMNQATPALIIQPAWQGYPTLEKDPFRMTALGLTKSVICMIPKSIAKCLSRLCSKCCAPNKTNKKKSMTSNQKSS